MWIALSFWQCSKVKIIDQCYGNFEYKYEKQGEPLGHVHVIVDHLLDEEIIENLMNEFIVATRCVTMSEAE